MSSYKVALNGLPGGGKTETIKAVSDIPLVSILKKIPLTQNAIMLDYGRVHVEPHMCYFYAAADGTLRSDDWRGLSSEMDGLLYVVDGSAVSVKPALALLGELLTTWAGPTVIGVNSTGKSEPLDDVYTELVNAYGAICPVYPYNAIARTSVLPLVRVVVEAIVAAKRSP